MGQGLEANRTRLAQFSNCQQGINQVIFFMHKHKLQYLPYNTNGALRNLKSIVEVLSPLNMIKLWLIIYKEVKIPKQNPSQIW